MFYEQIVLILNNLEKVKELFFTILKVLIFVPFFLWTIYVGLIVRFEYPKATETELLIYYINLGNYDLNKGQE